MSKIIDFHAHLIPPKLIEAIRRNGAAYGVESSGTDSAPAIRLEGSSWTKPIPLPLCASPSAWRRSTARASTCR